MPTTSSPWASPSSPAGRRLLLAEPATADHIPLLDEATLAVGAALVAASDASPRPPRAASVPHRRRPPRHRGLGAAALVLGLLAFGAVAGPERLAPSTAPAPAADTTAAPARPLALGRATGAVMGSDPRSAAGGEVAVALIEPTEAVRAEVTPASAPSNLAGRMGTLAVLATASAAG